MDKEPIEITGDGKQHRYPLMIIVDKIPFAKHVRLVHAIDGIYHDLSGDHLQLLASEQLEGSLAEGDVRETNYSVDVPREEVHDAIVELLADPATQQRVRADLERRFPQETWANNYPFRWAAQALLEALENH